MYKDMAEIIADAYEDLYTECPNCKSTYTYDIGNGVFRCGICQVFFDKKGTILYSDKEAV